jgi:hypothetical protein
MQAETAVRDALRRRLVAESGESLETVAEFWVPRSHVRADLAVIGRSMDGFEIKTERDSLQRLPRQAVAYGRVFDQCTVVVAEKHCDRVHGMLPPWWGITTVSGNGTVVFTEVRAADSNPELDPDTLVRLLWHDEAMAALTRLGREPDKQSSRNSLWHELLQLPVTELREVVRRAILHRDPAQARIATRRFMVAGGVSAAAR